VYNSSTKNYYTSSEQSLSRSDTAGSADARAYSISFSGVNKFFGLLHKTYSAACLVHEVSIKPRVSDMVKKSVQWFCDANPLLPRLVLSFMSQWKDGGHPPRSPTAATTPDSPTAPQVRQESAVLHSPTTEDQIDRSVGQSPIRRRRDPVDRPPSRPNSILANGYQPPLMEIAKDTPPELQPIFAYLNSHSNKLYQEGYFLKLHDLDSRKLGVMTQTLPFSSD